MSNYDIETFPSAGKRKRLPSNTLTMDFTALRIGTSVLPISESTGTLSFGATVLSNLGAPVSDNDAATRKFVIDQIAALGSSLEWQQSCLSRSVTPPGSPSEGQRYLLDLVLGTPSGAWTGNGDKIAQYTSGTWVFTTVTTGCYVSVDAESDGQYYYGGSGWVKKYFEATTASNGVQKIGFDISVKFETTNPSLQYDGAQALGIKFDGSGGLEKNANGTAIKLNGNALNLSVSGIKVSAGGITAVEINLSAVGAGLTGGGGSALAVGAGTAIKTSTGNTSVDFAATKTNDNAGAVTLGQIVYAKITTGNVDLAIATNTGLFDAEIGIVEDASIASGAPGKVIFRRGCIAAGFTGLTIGKMVYVSRAVAGGYTQDLTVGFVAGDQIVEVGRAFSATSVTFDPRWSYEY
jgi:hypothetical protein